MQTFRLLLTAKCISSEFLTALSSTVCFRREIPVPVEHSPSRAGLLSSPLALPSLLGLLNYQCKALFSFRFGQNENAKSPRHGFVVRMGNEFPQRVVFGRQEVAPGRRATEREREGERKGELVGSH